MKFMFVVDFFLSVERFFSFLFSSSQNLGQSAALKLGLGVSSCLLRLRVVMMGMWSIFSRCSSGIILHSKTCSCRELDANTLSGWV